MRAERRLVAHTALVRAATYVRISASSLGEEAPGLDRQRNDVERLCKERGWEVVGRYQDADISAYRDVPRPGFEELRQLVEHGPLDAVVAWKLDRAFRRIAEAVEFLTLCRQRGVTFVSQQEGIDTSTPWGPVLFSLFASLAEMESRTRSDRITAWHEQRARAGKPAGGGSRPFGFEDDRVTHRPDEVGAIWVAAQRILAGSSLRSEARRVGLTTTGLKRVLTAPRTAGLRQHGSKTYPAAWEPILEEQTWLQLRQVLDRPGHEAGRRYLLTGGLARCGLCGSAIVARPKAGGRRCYTCAKDAGGCGHIRVLAEPLEAYVAEQTAEREAELPDDPPQVSSDEELRSALQADERALEELARDRYVRRSITDAEFRAAREDLVGRIADAQERLSRPRLGVDFSRLTTPMPWILPPGVDPDREDLDGWRRWITSHVERVSVGPAVRGRNRFDHSRVTIIWR
jgi:DNA invertase Pin-like site-specific DNA recombinase